MKAPAGLTAEGRAAWKRAAELVDDPERHVEAIVRYARAVDATVRIRTAWEKDGCPVTTLGGATGSTVAPHPVPRMLREAEAHAQKLADELGLLPKSTRRQGRPVLSAAGKDVPASPPRIRRVK